MSLFRESEKKKREKFTRWAHKVEKAVAKKTRKLDLFVETQLVLPESDSDILELFHSALGHVSEYGILLSGTIDDCGFVAMLPFRSEVMVFLFYISIDFNALCVNTSGNYSMRGDGKWVCEPKDRKKARQMNKRFPKPVVQRFTGTCIERIERGGHLCPAGEECTELSLYGLSDEQEAIDLFAKTLGSFGGIVQLLDEWSESITKRD
jgi:hypothetical protein